MKNTITVRTEYYGDLHFSGEEELREYVATFKGSPNTSVNAIASLIEERLRLADVCRAIDLLGSIRATLDDPGYTLLRRAMSHLRTQVENFPGLNG